MSKTVVGLLAHVDAGKTTLAEALLYVGGKLRTQGRVDHGNAYLDNNELERERGITIFSKQAELTIEGRSFVLLDTPGHVDFSAEMERTLSVIDYALLVISALDGVQSHTRTVWGLLKRKKIPVFIFVNKLDRPETDKEKILLQLKEQLDEGCTDFTRGETDGEFLEELALCEDGLLDKFLNSGSLSTEDISGLIARRLVFPCFFGSALKLEGIKELTDGMLKFIKEPQYKDEFGARVYKIARDAQNNRLAYMKITGGSLSCKDVINTQAQTPEKVNQIRIYSGEKYETAEAASAGSICAVMGLSSVKSGDGLGMEPAMEAPVLEPVLDYKISVPESENIHEIYTKLLQLGEELPETDITWENASGEIHARVMGEVQIEVLSRIILERFGVSVSFDEGSIVYKESISEPAVGVGHFEPLRHYAEVHLRLEPMPRGSGLVFDTQCSEDELARNWQRLIITHLAEKQHVGVLTGSKITDMKITLITGRAHLKHTEGGDFRQATYRAVRNGLKYAKCVLLEPVYEYMLELPQGLVGRAMTDLQRMGASIKLHEGSNGHALITGVAPVKELRSYQREVISYTGGEGNFSCVFCGYDVCHDAPAVISQIGYDSERDIENPTGSVFCAHGAGFNVPWDRVRDFMHLEEEMAVPDKVDEEEEQSAAVVGAARASGNDFWQEDKELKAIFERTYGEAKPRQYNEKRRVEIKSPDSSGKSYKSEFVSRKDKYLLVDGYNIMFAWEELRELSKTSVEAARQRLMDILCNYQGYKKINVILVFDAYKVEGGLGENIRYHNINVVYTKEAETADTYIERVSHELTGKYDVTVATSDALEQLIIWGAGALRMSANELHSEILQAQTEIREKYVTSTKLGNALGEYMHQNSEETNEDRK